MDKPGKDSLTTATRSTKRQSLESSAGNADRPSTANRADGNAQIGQDSIRAAETNRTAARSIPASDQQLAFLANLIDNRGGPPIPEFRGKNDGTSRFLESLKNPIEILPADSDFVKERKLRLIQLREDMKLLIDEGASFNEVVKEQQKIVRENAETRRNAVRELRGILESGDRQGAEKYLRVVNVAFQQMGIEEMDMPMTKEERKAKALEMYNLKHAEKENKR